MAIPAGEISGARFEQIFMAQPGITAVPNTNPQIYTLPGETVIEVFPFDGFFGTTRGIYTVVDYNTYLTRQEGLFGGEPTFIRGTPRFGLIDPTGTREVLSVGTNNVKIIKINGVDVNRIDPAGRWPPAPVWPPPLAVTSPGHAIYSPEELERRGEALEPPPREPSPPPRHPCQEGDFRVARPYQQGRPEAPQAYSDCRNCNDDDPITLEEIQSIPLDELIVLPSGYCMKRSNMDRMRGPLLDPLTRERIGGKNRKSRKRKSRKRKSKKGKTRKKRLTKKRKH